MKGGVSNAAAWTNSLNAPSSGIFPGTTTNGNGTSASHLSVPPPGVPPPLATFGQNLVTSTPNPNLFAPTDSAHATPAVPGRLPQTPAQQILMSAADRWGLLGLIAAIKNADAEGALLSIGTDLGTMGLDMGQAGCVTFVLPLLISSSFLI
jgi:CCR4-NOT transcription complex subunit 2